MKKINFLNLIILWALVACKPDITERGAGEYYSLTEGISGSWEIMKVEVNDLSLPVPEKTEISDYYLNQSARLALNFDVTDNTYSVENGTLAGSPFGTSGTFSYQVNDQGFPTGLRMITNGQDTVNFDLLNMVRAIDPVMGISNVLTACDKQYAAYQYTFKRK